MKIVFVTVSSTAIRDLLVAGRTIQERYPGVLDLRLLYSGRQVAGPRLDEMRDTIAEADAVLVDLMGSPSEVVAAVDAGLERCRGQIIPFGQTGRSHMRLGALTADSMKMEGMGMGEPRQISPEAMRRMATMAETAGKIVPVGKMRDMRNLSQLAKYFRLADVEQLTNMLCLILRDYGGHKEIPRPDVAREAPVLGIRDPATRTYYKNVKQYGQSRGFDKSKPCIALLSYGHTYPDDTAPSVAAIRDRLEEIANVLPIAFGGTTAENFAQLREWLLNVNGQPVDLILNFMSFRLGAGPMGGDAGGAIDVLREVGAPYVHPFFMTRRRIKEWRESAQGLSANEFLISVMLPELDGCAEALLVGAMGEPYRDEDTGTDVSCLALIDERVDRLVSRVQSLLALRRKPNSEKRIAIIGYNYPPGEGNIFGGSFLDTFASIGNVLENLQAEGYETGGLDVDALRERFSVGGIVNSGRYGADEDSMPKYLLARYQETLSGLPDEDLLTEQWGEAPGDVMVSRGGDFLIPGVIGGNVFVGLQPSRGIHEDPEKAYHDKDLLPHHQYIAFYRWLLDDFKADAIIHVGTHGTLEFLKGKESGMSGDCFPDHLVAHVPHVYLYYVGNPSEAMIARRRSHANLVGYQPPEYVQGDLYGEYVELSAMIDEYREALRASPVRSQDVLRDVVSRATALSLPTDLDELEHELYRMRRSLIPKGLHVFGRGYDEAEARNYARGLLRYDRGEVKSLTRLAAEIEGLDYDALLDEADTGRLAHLDRAADDLFDRYLDDGSLRGLDPAHHAGVLATLEYARGIMVECRRNDEIGGLLRTLRGEYNPARLAGDIFRDPEVMPTGYNLYQFDPRFVPSPTATERGWKIAEATLERYRADNGGQLPISTAVILWGLETSRTQGETVAQILAYLGVRVVRGGNVWEPRYQIMSLEELGRPRVDVVINICGFFRDMFPNVMGNLNKVFEELATLDEPDEMNRFKANTRKLRERLLELGYGPEEAEELAAARIFGPDQAQYGTGITGIIETKNWEREEQIGEEFVKKLSYVYSKNRSAGKVQGLFDEHLKSVDLVSQTRSNHEYEITDLDHYYEFFGGLAKSVETARGSKACQYITDTTGERIVAEGVEKAIGRGIRTRVLNPKWIDGMLEHKYHGVQKIAERFENVMGLAATTNRVELWIYDDLYRTYIEDEDMRRRLRENNPAAYQSIAEQMMEFYQRGYWNAGEEQREKLMEVYLELEGDIEERL
jgi:cobaltochelatase CobN